MRLPGRGGIRTGDVPSGGLAASDIGLRLLGLFSESSSAVRVLLADRLAVGEVLGSVHDEHEGADLGAVNRHVREDASGGTPVQVVAAGHLAERAAVSSRDKSARRRWFGEQAALWRFCLHEVGSCGRWLARDTVLEGRNEGQMSEGEEQELKEWAKRRDRETSLKARINRRLSPAMAQSQELADGGSRGRRASVVGGMPAEQRASSAVGRRAQCSGSSSNRDEVGPFCVVHVPWQGPQQALPRGCYAVFGSRGWAGFSLVSAALSGAPRPGPPLAIPEDTAEKPVAGGQGSALRFGERGASIG